LNVAPANEIVDLWQVSQVAVVCTWLLDLPLADVPLWQLAQPLETPVWLNVAPANEVVDLWQVSQVAVVSRWLLDLPLADVPL
jgi:hypothetical protein